MKIKKRHVKIIRIVVLVVLVAAAALIVVLNLPEKEKNYDLFAKCLTNKSIVFYGSDSCPHCQNQKSMFGSSFQYVQYVNCEKNETVCVEKNIKYYPTWEISGKLIVGEKPLKDLSKLSGCNI
jgi:hypothetical protein